MLGSRFLRHCSFVFGALILGLALAESPALASPGAGPGASGHAASSRSQPGPGPHRWETAWSASPVDMGDAAYTGTVRNVIFTSAGGNTVRVRLSNVFGTQPYEFGDVSVGVSDADGNITGPVVPLTFRGQRSVTVAPGAEVVSDPASLAVPALHDLAVSVYVPQDDGEQTGHPDAQQVNYLTFGTDNVMDRTTAAYGQLSQWYYADSVDVTTRPRVRGTVVAFGDSITDGFNSTVNANARWPNDLARRLNALPGPTLSVADAGISANQVLAGSGQSGVSALLRFHRDVAERAGARDVIFMEGINDVDLSSAPAGQIIAGDKQIIADAHAAGLKIFGATLTPFRGFSSWTPDRQHTVDVVNRWIRTSGAFDGVIDFARAVADPSDPEAFYPAYDSGDHLHPNDAGYQAMANAVNLAMLLHG